jgi:hypothetical protein
LIGGVFDPDTDPDPDADKAGTLLFTNPSKLIFRHNTLIFDQQSLKDLFAVGFFVSLNKEKE